MTCRPRTVTVTPPAAAGPGPGGATSAPPQCGGATGSHVGGRVLVVGATGSRSESESPYLQRPNVASIARFPLASSKLVAIMMPVPISTGSCRLGGTAVRRRWHCQWQMHGAACSLASDSEVIILGVRVWLESFVPQANTNVSI